jgi:hypothetical protein
MSVEPRDRLAEIEAEHASLKAEVRAFQADYMRHVGVIMAQVHDLEARILTRTAERSGSEADREAARAAGERAERTYAQMRAVPMAGGPLPTGDLKQLFREAAKRMHPDLAPDDDTRRHAEAFMKRLNQAFTARDEQAILDLVRQWESSPYATVAVPLEEAESVLAARRVSALQAAVDRARARLEEVRASDLAGLMERAMVAATSGTDLMAEWRAASEAALAAARVQLAALQ